MKTYHLLIAMLVLLVNFGFAFFRLGKGSNDVFSLTLLLSSVAVAVIATLWIRTCLKEALRCKNGHAVSSDANFCPKCGAPRLTKPPEKDTRDLA
jgi:ammonia channel protein AmtB